MATAKPIIIFFLIFSKRYNFMMGDLGTNPYKIAEVFNIIHIPKKYEMSLFQSIIKYKKGGKIRAMVKPPSPPPIFWAILEFF